MSNLFNRPALRPVTVCGQALTIRAFFESGEQERGRRLKRHTPSGTGAALAPGPGYGWQPCGSMATLAVYQFEIYDRTERRFRRDGRYATAAAIQELQGLLLTETRREVDAAHVDAAGWYVGPPALVR